MINARHYKKYYTTPKANRIFQLTRLLSSVQFNGVTVRRSLRPLSTTRTVLITISHTERRGPPQLPAAADEYTNSHAISRHKPHNETPTNTSATYTPRARALCWRPSFIIDVWRETNASGQ